MARHVALVGEADSVGGVGKPGAVRDLSPSNVLYVTLVFRSPVEPGAGQQPDRAPVQPGVHPVAVEFDFVEPVWPVGRLVDDLGELRFDPAGKRRRFVPPPSCE